MAGYPIYYLCEFTSLATANNQTKNITFNDPGLIKGVTFSAISAAGTKLERAAFFVNVQRQNQRGLTTGDVSADAWTGTGERPYSIAGQLGQYRIERNDSLQVTVTNRSGTTATYAQVVFILHAD